MLVSDVDDNAYVVVPYGMNHKIWYVTIFQAS